MCDQLFKFFYVIIIVIKKVLINIDKQKTAALKFRYNNLFLKIDSVLNEIKIQKNFVLDQNKV